MDNCKIVRLYAATKSLVEGLHRFENLKREDLKQLTKEERLFVSSMVEFSSRFNNHLTGLESWVLCHDMTIPTEDDVKSVWDDHTSNKGKCINHTLARELEKVFEAPDSAISPHRILLVNKFEFANSIFDSVSIQDLYTEDIYFINLFSEMIMDISKLYSDLRLVRE